MVLQPIRIQFFMRKHAWGVARKQLKCVKALLLMGTSYRLHTSLFFYFSPQSDFFLQKSLSLFSHSILTATKKADKAYCSEKLNNRPRCRCTAKYITNKVLLTYTLKHKNKKNKKQKFNTECRHKQKQRFSAGFTLLIFFSMINGSQNEKLAWMFNMDGICI